MAEQPPKAYSYLRMSTPQQLKGHSRKRQLELSTAFATENGLELVPAQQLEDIGVSAFRGADVKGGALGRFLAAAEAGVIPKGSYLLVESLDRISRQQILESFTVFLRIINAGINVVDVLDKHVYRADQLNEMDLIISLTRLSRGNEESRRKGERVGAAWANNRRLAFDSKRPMTQLCPAWLRLSDDRKRFEKIPGRVAIIQSIFEDTVAGIGGYVIHKRLNKNGVPAFGRSKGWRRSYIAKILNNRAVIGEYQPCKLVDGKRKPVGEPIKDYFPRVIEDELFYRASTMSK